MKGKKYLKVTGILLSIGGILGIIVYGLLDLILGMGFMFDMTAGGIEVIALGAFYLALSVFQLIVGVYGVKYCDNAEKAKFCHTLGLIMIELTVVVFMIYHVWMPSEEPLINAVFSTFLSALVPAFYTYGAMLNLQNKQ